MFDVFDILVPELSTDHLEVRQQQTAFGSSDDRFAYVGDLRFAQIVTARQAYTSLEAWTGAPGRAGWTVLLAAPAANAAAGDDDTWARFLAALMLVLRGHATWRVNCESDCEQHPLEELELAPERLSQLLESYRSRGTRPIAVQVSSP